MNQTQREIIVDAYEQYIKNGMRGDPVGGFSDIEELFRELKKTDQKLCEEMEERFNEIPDKI